MAEVKNAFIKSKMNKDLDSRLLPSGEYRDGQNIQVSKSEGEDVGALENAVGNIPAVATQGDVDFSVLSGCGCNLKSIGIFADTNSANIYVFLTDYGPDTEAENNKYSPTSNNYIYSYNTLTTTTVKLVEGSFLNFSQNNPIYGINVLEDLLFWTDNRNQPRKINLSLANPDVLEAPTYYTSEDTISVAKYNPYEVIDLYYLDGPPNQPSNIYVSSLQDVTSLNLPDGNANPYYNADWPGDPDYLEDKFVTFSYRFKFIDGEQSIMAPFTQEAFIPKQDGYFLGDNEDDAYRSTIVRFMENKVNSVGLYIPLPFAANELSGKLNVSEIEILYKESDSLTVKVLDSVPSSSFKVLNDGSTNTTFNYLYDYQSRKPYKTLPESEIIRVYDKVPVKAFGQEVIGNRIVYSNFQDKHTPPPTIDYDTAVTPKENFDVSSDNKSTWTTSEREYPMHTVKQNRNYQAGFVLSDRYGRQSTVILSPVTDKKQTDIATGIIFGGSTFYHPYTADPTVNDIDSWPGDSLKILLNNPIPSALEDQTIKGYPSLYNGDASSADYNPLGWYSYKIVVKQTEQEYYNVYLPGILNGYPDYTTLDPPPDPENSIAHITLIGDNINKVPRNLTEVGPEQKQYGSEVQLFGRVTPENSATPSNTIPYYPQINSQTVVTISEQNNLFADADPVVPYGTIYQTDSNPYVARLAQNNVGNPPETLPLPIGSQQVSTGTIPLDYNILLGVFETAPVESLLDIFWETSTAGLISDLNKAAGADNSASGFFNFNYIQTEATVSGDSVTELPFAPSTDSGLGAQPMQFSSIPVSSFNVSSAGVDITSDFVFTKINANSPSPTGSPTLGYDSYLITVANPKRFRADGSQNTFTFSFSITNNTPGIPQPPATITRTVISVLGNESPSIDGYTGVAVPPVIDAPADRPQSSILYTFYGKNGATALPANDQLLDLKWSIQSGSQIPTTPVLAIQTVGSTGQLSDPGNAARGGYSFNLVLKDAEGNSGFKEVVQNVSIAFGQEQTNLEFGSSGLQSKILSKGLQSSGLFWGSDYSDPSLIDTSVIPVGGFISTGSGTNSRNAYQNVSGVEGGTDFVLNNTGLQGADINRDYRIYESTTNPVDDQDNKYRWKNENYKPSYFGTGDNSDSSLKKGTAYIKLDFRFKGWPSYSDNSYGLAGSGGEQNISAEDQLGVSWLAYLQYRPDGASSWTTATDVEGKDISFGNTQQNQLGLSGAGSSIGGDNFLTQGVLVDSTTSAPYSLPQQGELAENMAVSTSQWVGASSLNSSVSTQGNNNKIPSATSSKVFVFGKDQGYKSSPDRFGEYRLLVKYPQNIQRPPYARMVPTPRQNFMPNWILNGSNGPYAGGPLLTDFNIDVKVSFGDFYYKDTNTPSSFGYRVSSPVLIENSASFQDPSTEVWAREWSHKYVTQFYNDADLTEPATGFIDNYWCSYSALTTQGSPLNTQSGSENSGVSGFGTPNDADLLRAPTSIANRRWVAQFDSTGKKIKGTAKPCNSGDLS